MNFIEAAKEAKEGKVVKRISPDGGRGHILYYHGSRLLVTSSDGVKHPEFDFIDCLDIGSIGWFVEEPELRPKPAEQDDAENKDCCKLYKKDSEKLEKLKKELNENILDYASRIANSKQTIADNLNESAYIVSEFGNILRVETRVREAYVKLLALLESD